MKQANDDAAVVRISPPGRFGNLNASEIWAYRGLLYFLVWRDLKVRYKQTVMGAAWALVQPLMPAIVFTVIFHYIANIPAVGSPYPVFAFSGLILYTVFAQGLTAATNSLVQNAHMLTKVYFPRLVLPIAAAASFLIDLVVSIPVLFGLMIFFDTSPSARIILAPAFILLAFMATIGAGLWLSALNVRYRDVRYAVSLMTQLLLYVTPILYSSQEVPDRWRLIYGLNPMAGAVEGFRWSVLGSSVNLASLLVPSVVTTLLLLLGGFFFFGRSEQTFADVI